jgi:glycosyltransferase involved in cell wall biosynthesis
MVTQPLVSIIINNYNYARFLSDAIDSTLAQTYSNIEVIVVDDGSTDNSQEVITSYNNQIISVFKENGGQASALNAGFAASKGEIICLLDADDLFLPDKVSEVASMFQSDSTNDWVFTESAPIESEDMSNTEKLQNVFYQISEDSSSTFPKKIDFRANILNAQLPDFTPSTSNLCFSRRLLEKMFPIPEVRGFSGIAINDYYIKYLAVALGVGCVTTRNLGIFRLHNNTFTTQDNPRKMKIYAENLIVSSYWTRVKFPDLYKLSNKLMSKGCSMYLKSKDNPINYNPLIKEYLKLLSFNEKIFIYCKTFSYLIKLRFVDLV